MERIDHPGLEQVGEVLAAFGLRAASGDLPLSEAQRDRLQAALDVMTGVAGTDTSVPALLAHTRRLEQLGRAVVEAVDREHENAVLRVGNGREDKEATLRAVEALRAETAPAPASDGDLAHLVVGLPAGCVRHLETLTGGFGPADVEGVLLELADHAHQGVYRPGSWERHWLVQAFGPDFVERLEPDPDPGRARMGWVVPREERPT